MICETKIAIMIDCNSLSVNTAFVTGMRGLGSIEFNPLKKATRSKVKAIYRYNFSDQIKLREWQAFSKLVSNEVETLFKDHLSLTAMHRRQTTESRTTKQPLLYELLIREEICVHRVIYCSF